MNERRNEWTNIGLSWPIEGELRRVFCDETDTCMVKCLFFSFSSFLFSSLSLSLARSCSSSTYMSIDSFLLTSFQWEKTLMSMDFLFRRVQCKYPMTRVETIEGLEDSIRLIESHWSFVASHIALHRSRSAGASIGKIYIWPDMRLVCERMLISITMIIKRKWKWMANAICSFHTDTYIADNVDIDHHHQRKYFLSVWMGRKRWAESKSVDERTSPFEKMNGLSHS